ncbi:glucose-fructose oxidoreductase [Fusarium albosuccineum]|uniref:Glucose-fructose oxidoreductase n=1 Tax=Fusarium albosuccineum TaxID=1237068 RepID=A0A8H4L952_9HYPO|nr:glucose-fructose oxidoreductase [Fusarium albosuccineum]
MEHMPGIMKCDSLVLKAIYSRSMKSAQNTAALSTKGTLDLYSADSEAGKSLDDLLQRQDISAVIIALPIDIQPKVIEQVIRAGKHVLAEKPIAPDVTTTTKLIDLASSHGVTYSVAENYRFIPKFIYAAEEAKKLGKVTNFSVKATHFMGTDNFWYQTEWRRGPRYQGGFLLDGGDSKADSVSALTNLTLDHLAPVDTLNGVVKTKSGAAGTFQMSFGSRTEAFEWDFGLEGGAVKLSGDTVTVKPANGEAVVKEFPEASGVTEEIAVWAEGLVSGKPNTLQSPQEAMADLELLTMMFESGESNGTPMAYSLQ